MDNKNKENSIGKMKPYSVYDWDYLNNIGTPYGVGVKSKRLVNWKCHLCGHTWIQEACKYKHCPICKHIVKDEAYYKRSSSLDDHLTNEWDFNKNSLSILDVKNSSLDEVWWKCSRGHSFKESINKRHKTKSMCPICNKLGLVYYPHHESILTVNQDIINIWDFNKNAFKPSEIRKEAKIRVWVNCELGHSYEVSMKELLNSTIKCPVCNIKSVGGTSYGEQYIYWGLFSIYKGTLNRDRSLNGLEYDIIVPEIKLCIEYSGVYWHRDKQHLSSRKEEECKKIGYTFIELFEGAIGSTYHIENNKIYFGLNVEHREDVLHKVLVDLLNLIGIYDKEIDFEDINNKAIIYSERVVNPKDSLRTNRPDLAKEWDSVKNGVITPDMVRDKSRYQAWWICRNNHSWKASIARRYSGSSCPVCRADSHKKPGYGESLAERFPDIASEWHPTMNGDLTANDVKYGSAQNVWWLGRCKHAWECKVVDRTHAKMGCPYCSGSKVLQGFNDLASKFPDIASEWNIDKNGNKYPNNVIYNTSDKVWWKCKQCGNEWVATVNNRTMLSTGCPNCSRRRKDWQRQRGPKTTDLNRMTIIYPEVAMDWDYSKNTDIDIHNVAYGSQRNVYWKCHRCGHEWKAIVAYRCSGHDCPVCNPCKSR